MIGLTPKMAEALDAIARLTRSGVPPSYDELQAELGLGSKSGVHRLDHALRQRGAIEFQDHAKRSISVVTDPGAMELLDARTSDHLRAIRDRCDLILRARAQ